MLWFHNLSFRLKLLLPLGVVIMIALVVSLLNIGSITSITRQTQNLTQLYLPAVQLVLEADRDLHQALIAERALLQEKPGSEAFAGYQDSRKENLGQVRARMQDVGDFELGPQVDRLVTTFFAQLKEWEAASRAVENAALEASGSAVALSFGEGEAAFDRARENLNKLSELLHAEAQALGMAVEAHAREVRFSQILGNGIMLVLLATIAILLPAMVIRSINAIRARVDDIAQGEGDLTRRLDVSSRDEFGQLSASFNGFLEKLHRSIGDMAGYTREVAAASGQLSAIAAGNNRLVDEQHGSIDSVVTAANEMSSAIQDVARSTAEAATESQSAARHSESGKRQVQQTIGAMTGLRESVEDASTVVAQLADDTSQIAAVLEVIRAIAEQTNLLALNAAIEAARAGEQGRGFAVVADEVRTLANRTQQSTRDIEDTIGRLQSGVRGAVAAMQEGSRKADSTLAEARQTEAFLDAIAQSVTRINDMGTQIASAAEQQSAVTEDINRNMVAIGDQSRQVAAGASQTSSASTELARLATQLQGVVDQFRV